MTGIGALQVLRIFGELWSHKLLTVDTSHSSCRSSVMGLANEHLFVEFREFCGSEGPATRCGELHQSFTDTLACSSVGHAFSEINEDRRQIYRRVRNLAHW